VPEDTERHPRRVDICGVGVDQVTMADSLAAAEHIITACRGAQHVSINAAKVIKARRDPQIAAIVAGAALATADGQSIVLAGRLLGTPLPERVTGIDFMTDLLSLAERRGFTVYLYGAKPSTVRAVNDLITGRGVNVVGYDSGFEDDPEAVAARIAAYAPDLLFVALPTPAKELFIGRHLTDLGVGLAVGVGGSFDVLAGEVSRAPWWMQRIGLEWLHRIALEPQRVVRPYFVRSVVFLGVLAAEVVRVRGRSLVPRRRRRGDDRQPTTP
jgi:N-acetylglucosaminyldiphosphoundecaprenol N-acetyl-beta-D-mannosaminyltransferase